MNDESEDPVECHLRMTRIIKERSHSNVFKEAVQEWDQNGSWYEPEQHCECGHPIVYCWSMVNKVNGNVIDPVGSECMKRFQRKDLDDKVKTQEKRMKKQQRDKNWLAKEGQVVMYNRGKWYDGMTQTEWYAFMLRNGILDTIVRGSDPVWRRFYTYAQKRRRQ